MTWRGYGRETSTSAAGVSLYIVLFFLAKTLYIYLLVFRLEIQPKEKKKNTNETFQQNHKILLAAMKFKTPPQSDIQPLEFVAKHLSSGDLG